MPTSLELTMATRNPGKAVEFDRLVGDRFRVVPLPDDIDLPEETGGTFAENARLKAEAAFTALGRGRAVLADDSGLEVTALGGEPGVRSARYAGPDAGDGRNVALLLERLGGEPDRSARFVCALHLVVPSPPAGDARRYLAEGYLSGTITHRPRGTGGFGYDPVFRPLEWELTLAEVPGAQKDAVSHRAAAVRQLLGQLAGTGDPLSRE